MFHCSIYYKSSLIVDTLIPLMADSLSESSVDDAAHDESGIKRKGKKKVGKGGEEEEMVVGVEASNLQTQKGLRFSLAVCCDYICQQHYFRSTFNIQHLITFPR